MRKRLAARICRLGLWFLDWGYREFGTEDREDWLWMNEQIAKLKAEIARAEGK